MGVLVLVLLVGWFVEVCIVVYGCGGRWGCCLLVFSQHNI